MNFSILRRISYLAAAGLIFFSASCGDNQRDNLKIEGIDGPNIALIQDQILITTVFENIQIDGGLRYILPKFENSYVEVGPDLNRLENLSTWILEMSRSWQTCSHNGRRTSKTPSSTLSTGIAPISTRLG